MRLDLCLEHWLLSDSLCKQKSHWIFTINGKVNVLKCKLFFFFFFYRFNCQTSLIESSGYFSGNLLPFIDKSIYLSIHVINPTDYNLAQYLTSKVQVCSGCC